MEVYHPCLSAKKHPVVSAITSPGDQQEKHITYNLVENEFAHL